MISMLTYATVNHRPSAPPGMPRGLGADAVPHKLLAEHRLLNLLPEQDLSSLLQWSKIRTPRRQEVILRQGDPGNAVVLVLEGFIKLSVTLADGREMVLDIIGPGDCFGEMAVLNKMPHETDATALVPCRLLMVDGRQFRHALEVRPEGLPTILRLESERLHRAREQMVDSLALSAAARLAKVLMRLAKLWSSGARQGDFVRLLLSQSELGSMTGLSRESVNKLLGSWRDAGWIRLSNRSVTLMDVTALTRLSQFGMSQH